jgi:nicotinamidase-related amidase
LIVDWQERLAAVEPEEASLRGQKTVGILCEAARVLGVPVVLSEQYPRGLGPPVPDVAEAARAAGATPVEKVEFGCTNNPEFQRIAAGMAGRSWIVCGMESHVCVWQTVRGLLPGGPVHVVADAVCSRTEDNRQLGLTLAREAGAVVTSTETVVFDLLGRAGSDAFKQLSKLIR